MRIFESSLRNFFERSCKVFFSKILQNIQGLDQDLAKILGKIHTGPLLGSLKILEDSMRIFESSLRNCFEGSCKVFFKVLQDIQGFDHNVAKTSGNLC